MHTHICDFVRYCRMCGECFHAREVEHLRRFWIFKDEKQTLAQLVLCHLAHKTNHGSVDSLLMLDLFLILLYVRHHVTRAWQTIIEQLLAQFQTRTQISVGQLDLWFVKPIVFDVVCFSLTVASLSQHLSFVINWNLFPQLLH